MADKGIKRAEAFADITTQSQFVWDDECLSGIVAARQYRKMRREDPTCASMFLALSLPIRLATWQCVDDNEEAAEFVWQRFTEDLSFPDLIADITTFFVYGWSYHGMVLQRLPDGAVGFAKIKQIPQWSLSRWEIDDDGDIAGLWYFTDKGDAFCDLGRALLFRTSREGDNPEGESVYRPAVRPFKYKWRLEQTEGLGLFRRWAGFPIVTLPSGASTKLELGDSSDEKRAEEIIEKIYKDELMGAVLPAGWSLTMGGPEGAIDTTMSDTIMRKDAEMVRAVLAQFLMMGMRKVGTEALSKTLQETFELSVEAFLGIIADELNKYAVPFLMRFNPQFGDAMPRLVPGSIKSVDLEAVAPYLKTMYDVGMLSPDMTTENFLRSLVPGMPMADTTSVSDESGGEAEAGGGDDDVSEASFSVGRFSSGDKRHTAFVSAADKSKAKLHRVLEQWANNSAWLDDLPPDASEPELREKLDDHILAGLLLFREAGMADIIGAYWLGFGGVGGGGTESLVAIENEGRTFDSYIGYDSGMVERVNPAGGGTLFGDIAGDLEGQIYAILLMLKDGRRSGIPQLIHDVVYGATQGFSRADLYAGSTWHSAWAGAVNAHQWGPDANVPVMWVLDPFARHSRQCPIFAGEYPSMQALLIRTNGILPGQGTDCDGNCRCGLKKKLPSGGWTWL